MGLGLLFDILLGFRYSIGITWDFYWYFVGDLSGLHKNCIRVMLGLCRGYIGMIEGLCSVI